LGPFPSRTATAAIEFFTKGVAVIFLYESTMSSAGCHRRRVLCRLSSPTSASGGIRSAAVTRPFLLPPPFLVVIVFGNDAPTELGSSAAASAADWINHHRLCC
jgi:hypothetical protein